MPLKVKRNIYDYIVVCNVWSLSIILNEPVLKYQVDRGRQNTVQDCTTSYSGPISIDDNWSKSVADPRRIWNKPEGAFVVCFA